MPTLSDSFVIPSEFLKTVSVADIAALTVFYDDQGAGYMFITPQGKLVGPVDGIDVAIAQQAMMMAEYFGTGAIVPIPTRTDKMAQFFGRES